MREQIADVVVLQREDRVEHGGPIHQLSVKPLKWTPVSGSTGSSPVGSMRSLPPMLPNLGRDVRDRSRTARHPTSGCCRWHTQAGGSIRRVPDRARSGHANRQGAPVVAGRSRHVRRRSSIACGRTSRAP